MQRIKKGSLLFMMLSVPVMAAFMYVWSAGPPDASAFPGPVDQCNTCHNIWAGGTSSPGHATHLAVVSNCNACHATVGDTPQTSRCGECHVIPGVAVRHNATGTTSCVGCHPGTAAPENTAVPGFAGTQLMPCTDGLDNDGDMALDGVDTDCTTTPPPAEICDDGIDNDGDGAIDSADTDCTTTPPPAEICNDGIDNDGDGAIDSADTDCTTTPPPAEICNDGIDNDGDGAIDSADTDCTTTPPPAEICDDGIDNDGDGKIDSADTDCTTTPPPVCPSVPADHTIKIRESFHKPGLKQPFANGCTSCHGSDLRGSDTAPSCLKCHGAKWESCDSEGRGFGWKNGHHKNKGNHNQGKNNQGMNNGNKNNNGNQGNQGSQGGQGGQGKNQSKK